MPKVTFTCIASTVYIYLGQKVCQTQPLLMMQMQQQIGEEKERSIFINTQLIQETNLILKYLGH